MPKDLFSVVFAKFDDLVELLCSISPGALMGKIDIKHVFRICPVQLADIELLGTFWQGSYFVELCLPFSLCSSLFIFNSFADALAWILHNYLIDALSHYLNDSWTAGPTNSAQCPSNLPGQNSKRVPQIRSPNCTRQVERSNNLHYLCKDRHGFCSSSYLPPQKFQKLLLLLADWATKKKCTKRELLSLIGKLAFAAKVVRSEVLELFLCCLIDLSTPVTELHHHISLNLEARKDIPW